MKQTYQVRVDYKDDFGNDIRITKNYKNKVAALFNFWRFSLPKNVSVTYMEGEKTRRKIIK
jgi:hypothetical protein